MPAPNLSVIVPCRDAARCLPVALTATGLAAATGRFVALLDADDWCAPGHLQALTAAIRRFDVDFVRCDHLQVAGVQRSLRRVPEGRRERSLPAHEGLDLRPGTLSAVDAPNIWAGVCDRRLAERGLLDVDPRIRTAKDRLMIWRLHLHAERFAVVDLHGYHSRREVAGSLTAIGDERQLHSFDACAAAARAVDAGHRGRAEPGHEVHVVDVDQHRHRGARDVAAVELQHQCAIRRSASTRRKDGRMWRMPAETEPHERTWMAFPRPNDTLGTGEDAEEAYAAWTAVAHAVLEFEPVTMLVDPVERDRARRMLSAEVDVLELPIDDCWLRDSGPSFVLDDDGVLGAVDWVFNGWGAQDWARWDHDAGVARAVADAAGAAVVPSALVQEGGAFHVDGVGSVLLTETVQLDPHRNPGATKHQVERELARTIGAQHAVWLPRGLTRDYERFGTRGHVDMVLTVPSPGIVLLHRQADPAHPDHAVTAALRQVLDSATTASGDPWRVIELPSPQCLRDDEGFVDWNYANHLAVNGGLVACAYDDPADARAVAVLQEAYPGRRVVTVDARPILACGGGIHCITQQQPARP